MSRFIKGAIALTFVLSACGGGGSGNSSTSGPVVTPTSTPTPTPTTTPTPSPTPLPAFGLSAPFYLTTSVGVTYRVFTYTDPTSLIPQARIIDGRLLEPSDDVSLSYEPDPESFRFSFAGQDYAYAAADKTFAGENLLYQRDGFRLGLGPIFSSGTERTVVSQAWPSEAYSTATEVGTAQNWLIALPGNISVEQSEINSPISFEIQPSVAGGDLHTTASLVTLSTTAITSTGKGVNGSVPLYRNVNATAEYVGTLRLLGTLDPATNTFVGTIVDSADADLEIGSFIGALYGPSRKQLGLVLRFSRPQEGGRIYIGYALASRN